MEYSINKMMGKASSCPFCNPKSEREILAENESAFAMPDKYPVSLGHMLIIPKRHCSNYFDLTVEEQTSCWELINRVQKIITDKLNPDGFNIGININETAGQTIPHVHIHLIPRTKGDVSEPEGGVRGVIPERKKYPSE